MDITYTGLALLYLAIGIIIGLREIISERMRQKISLVDLSGSSIKNPFGIKCRLEIIALEIIFIIWAGFLWPVYVAENLAQKIAGYLKNRRERKFAKVSHSVYK